ncbi:MAG: VanW family protein [Chloroflexi bacterium]|nr:VanW family protein [Chloroflexota bacterium]
MRRTTIFRPPGQLPWSTPRLFSLAGRRAHLALLASALALLAISLALGFRLAYAGRFHPGVRALGVDLGGASQDEARAALADRAAELAQRPLVLRYGDQTWTSTAAELGFQIGVRPALESAFAAGREGNPVEQAWAQLRLLLVERSFDRLDLAADSTVPASGLERLAREIERRAVDAQLMVLADGGVDYRSSHSGLRLDAAETQRRLAGALLDASPPPVDLAVEEVPPGQTDADLAEAKARVEKILAAPLVATFDGRRWVLGRAQLAELLSLGDGNGAGLEVTLDRPAVERWAADVARQVGREPRNARFAWANNTLEVLQPSEEGQKLDVAATVEAVLRQAPTDDREVVLPVRTTPPALPTEARSRLGTRELIEQSRTSFAGSVPAKRHNITLAAQRLNGVVVPPGATFSFNHELGPTTLDSGFQIGWGIATRGQQVKTVPSVAGGICQVATTLFHTVFWAGYPVEERHWHLYWIPAYTSKGVVGLDATVDEEAGLDFQFTNPTNDYLLIQAWVDEAQGVNFALYGTRPKWEVTVEPLARRYIQPADPTPVEEFEPSLPAGQKLQVEAARDGFTSTVLRQVVQDGQERFLRLTSDYQPSRNVTLVGIGSNPGLRAEFSDER